MKAIEVLCGFFGLKKNKLIWTGSLEDLKAFVLTEVDETIASNTTWRSPRGGTWCFDSDQLKVTWNSKSQTLYFEGIKATELTKRIHSKVLEKNDFSNVQKRDLNKSIECFIAEASLEGEKVNEAFNERSSEAVRPTFYTSLLQVGSVSCINGDFEADKDSNSRAADKSNHASPIAIERTSTTIKRQAGIQRRDISHANVIELSDERENLSFGCCGHCDDLKQEIKRLNAKVNSLKDSVYQHDDNSTMKMQINRLQCDNSSLVKTIEILSKQLCIQSERNINVNSQMKDITNLENKISEKGEDNSDNANPDNANPDNASKYKKKKKKKGKLPTSKPIQVNESMTKEDAPELATKADGDVSKPSTRPKVKETVVIAGDSLVKNIFDTIMGKQNPRHYYVVKGFPGATVSDMEDYVKPITRKSPDKVILHIGTNDLKNSIPKVIADSIMNLCTQIKEDSPTTMVGVSALLTRNDNPVLATKVKQVNLILDNYCQTNKLPFLRNANINTSHLNNKGLHLIKQGSLLLQNNFIEFTENF